MKVTIFRDYPEEGFPSMEVYADNLSAALKKIKPSLEFKEYLPLADWSKRIGYSSLKARLIFRFLIYPLMAPFRQSEVNHLVDHSYGHLAYFLDSKKTVVTVHDLDVLRLKFLKWPTFRDKVMRGLYLFSVSGLKRAALIIAVSEDTKNDLVRFLKIPKKKIVVIPEGVEPIFRKIDDKKKLAKIKKKYHLPEKYLLHVGECWQYKNIEGILRVFAALSQLNKFEDLFFVKVGGTWTEEQKKLIKQLKVEAKVVKLPFIPRQDLPGLYNLAQVLVQLSFLEGFGLTVLEAMACGCPVVVSTTPALKELVGEAGEVVKARDKKGAVRTLDGLLSKKNSYRQLSQKGLQRAKLYRWSKTANQTIKVYQKIIS